jgi:hypothetical protein
MNRKKCNILATQAVSDCLKIIRKAADAEHDCSPELMTEMILDTLAAELLANGRTNTLSHIPETAAIGGLVAMLINHGEWVLKEPVITHALRVLYMLGEEDRCKEIHDELRHRLSVTFG